MAGLNNPKYDDLISRTAAIAEIEEYINEYSEFDTETGYHSLKRCAMKEAKNVLLMLPSVDAVPVVHGRWEADSDGIPVCSVCDEIAPQRLHCDTLHETLTYDVRLIKTPYCPHCGAKMDGDKA